MRLAIPKKYRLNLFLFSLITIWIILLFFELIAHYITNIAIILPLLKKMFSLVCHQEPDKLFIINNIHSFVCVRCTGLYFGAWIGSFSIFVYHNIYLKVNRKYFFIALVLMFSDVFLVNTSLYIYNNYLSFFTGMFLGLVCFLYLYKSLFEFIVEAKTNV